MSDPEVVVRLLAAIDERERWAKQLRRERWFAVLDDTVGGWAVANVNKPVSEHDHRKREVSVGDFLSDNYAHHIAAHGPLDVLRLCQSHRDIVARFQRAWDRRNTGTPEEVVFRQTYTIAMIDVLADLARGYGVEDGEG